MPVIVIELFLVLGAVLAFAVWQFRDLAQERRRREQRQRQAALTDGAAGEGPRGTTTTSADDHAR